MQEKENVESIEKVELLEIKDVQSQILVLTDEEKIELTRKDIQKQYEDIGIKYSEFLNILNAAINLAPPPPGRFMRGWLWFQKHAFTSVIFVVLGITIGIFISEFRNTMQMEKTINIQRFEFKGDLFDVIPSSIKKYYSDGERTNIKNALTPVIELKTEQQPAEKKKGK